MTEVVLAAVVIIGIGCIIYWLKGDFFKKDVAVTVVKSLPLAILKKWIKEDKNIDIEQKVNSIEINDDKNSDYNAYEIIEEKDINIEFDERVNNIEKLDVKENNKEIKDTEEIDEINNISEIEEVSQLIHNEEIVVYWTPKGKTYHGKSTCRTLARSKVINSGTINESGKEFKCEHCKF